MARQNQIEVAELRRRLAADGMHAGAVPRGPAQPDRCCTRLRERELEPRVKVSDLDVDQFLREQQQASSDPAPQEINLAHVLVAVPENANEAQIAQLRAKAQRRAGARPRRRGLRQAGARELSDAPGAAANGGAVGLRTADRYPPLFVEATQNLPEGGVADLVRSGAGFHVIKVLEKRQGGAAGAPSRKAVRATSCCAPARS